MRAPLETKFVGNCNCNLDSDNVRNHQDIVDGCNIVALDCWRRLCKIKLAQNGYTNVAILRDGNQLQQSTKSDVRLVSSVIDT